MKKTVYSLLCFFALFLLSGKLEAQSTIIIDPSFNIGTGVTGFNTSVHSIALQPDGKILAGGDFTTFNDTTQNRLVRLNSDGALDASFDLGTGFDSQVRSITLQPDGKILVGGFFTAFNGTTQNRIARLNSDGTLDTSFNIGTGFNGPVHSIALQPDGKILAGGGFTSYNGQTQNKLVRLNSDGTLDTSLDLGTGFSYGVISIALQPDGKILVGGLFTKYNGTTQSRIARLQELACEIIPPTPTVELYHPDCYSPTESGTIIVTNPLGNQYQYSINGIDYQENTDFNNLPPGTYQVTVKEGCCISEPLEVVINFAPIFPEPLEVEVVQPTCNNPYGSIEVLTFTFPAGTYSINGGEDYQYSSMFENLLPGTYQVIFKSGYGICVTEIMEVTINPVPNPPPTPEATLIPIICSFIPEDIGPLVITYPLGDEYEYSIDGVSYQSSPVFPNVWAFGTLQITVRQGSCISEPLIINLENIEQSTIPIAEITQPDCLVVPESGQVGTVAVTFPLGDEFQYSIDGENYQDSPVFNNVFSGAYQLTFRIHNSEFCVSDSLDFTIYLSLTEVPIVEIIQPTCENPFGKIEIINPIDDGDDSTPNYEYSINGVDYYEFTLFDSLSSGVYYVTVRHLISGCISESVEVIINEVPKISIDLIPVCENENRFVLKAQDSNYEYLWNTGETSSEIEISNIGVYSVVVSLDNCSNEFSINIENIPCMITKGISPNGDSMNNQFDLSGFGTINKVEIYNRYGKIVYNQSNYTNQWKGQSNNGKELPTGTYYYRIVFQNSQSKTGWVYLNR